MPLQRHNSVSTHSSSGKNAKIGNIPNKNT